MDTKPPLGGFNTNGSIINPNLGKSLGNVWDTVTSNANKIGGVLSSAVNNLQSSTNPTTKQTQLANTSGNPNNPVKDIGSSGGGTYPVASGLINNSSSSNVPSSSASPGELPPAKPTTTTDVNAAHDAVIKATQDSLKSKQAQLKALQDNGLTDTSSLTQDANGNYVPASGVNTTTGTANGTGGTATSNDPYKANVGTLTDISKFQNDPQYLALLQGVQEAQNIATNTSLTGQGGPGEKGAETGVAGFLQQKNNNLLQSKQNELSNYLQGKGVEITAANDAAGLTKPEGNTAYYGSPYSGQVVGGNTSGAGNYGLPTSTGNPLMDKTISQALQLASQTNVDPMDPNITAPVKALNSPQAWQAYLDGVQAIKGGTYNPTITSATSGAAAGSAAKLTTDITDLNQNINQVDAAGHLVTTFMAQAPQINQTIYGMVNSQAQKYLQSIGATGELVQYNSLMDTVKKYATNIVSAGYSGTPTGAQALQELADPSNLSLQDVQKYLDTVKNDGQTQLGIKQQALKQLGGSTSVPAATPTTSTPAASPAVTSGPGANPYLQAGAATVGENLGDIWNSVKNIGGELLGGILTKLGGI